MAPESNWNHFYKWDTSWALWEEDSMYELWNNLEIA